MATLELSSKPETAAEALARWDTGGSVFTAEMGGLGPGYEQVIHIMAFEIIRELLTREPIAWEQCQAAKAGDKEEERKWRAFAADVERVVMPRIAGLGSSGAQYGAAENLAYIVVRQGWRAALDLLPSERIIQVSREWPYLKAEDKQP